jgi:lipopolysaccharide transport system ATP-binding protein
MKPIVRVEEISKKFRIGARRVAYDTLRERLAQSFRAPFNGKHKRAENFEAGWVWALRNISFEVLPAEVVGVIGRNGAGKSTLLKVLSRITEPTTGRAELYGRVGSLLEVGTGFHAELTGRENIYLNGAILGMSRREIQRKFDEIVDFAEVETFLDTPVKHYSSGMYMRLAFAVAAHLETEILIVDEVLAVGDTAFQRKCLSKMGAAAMEGRTVLFVSHNLAAVRTLCTRAILMDRGKIELDSNVEDVITRYLSEHSASDAMIVWDADSAPQTSEIRLVKGYILNSDGEFASRLDYRSEFTIAVEYEVLKPIKNLRVGFMLQTLEGTPICGSNDPQAWSDTVRNPGHYVSRCSFPGYTLNAGTYIVSFGSDNPPSTAALINPEPCLSFDVEVMEVHTQFNRTLPGVIRPKLDWKVERKESEVSVA